MFSQEMTDGGNSYTFQALLVAQRVVSCNVTHVHTHTYDHLTLQSAVVSDGYILKCLVRSRSNLHF